MTRTIGRIAAGVAFAASLSAAAAAARADDVPVFGTGVDDHGLVLAEGTPDPHYAIVQAPAGGAPAVPAPATVARAYPIYIPNSPVGGTGASWIATRSDTGSFYPPGHYVYRTQFDLTGFDATTAQLVGKAAVDDSLVDVRLNGVSFGGIPGAHPWAEGAFQLVSGFQDGVNVLEFDVVNGSGGPTGLHVVLSGTADPGAPADSTPPVITGCYDRALSWQGSPIALVAASLGITAVDDVDGSVAVTLSPSTVGLGTHVVTASASDAAGNTATHAFEVRVLDVTAPAIAGPTPASPSFEWTGSPISLTAAGLGLSATDDVDGAVPVTLTPSAVTLGDTQVVASAKDAAGNTASRSFSVHVADTVAPEFTSLSVSPDVVVACSHDMVQVTVSASVSDAGDPAPHVRIVSIHSVEAGTSSAPSLSGPDWNVTGDLTAAVRAERSGRGSGRTYVITVEATDASGNTSSSTVSVLVPHDNGADDRHRDSRDDDHRNDDHCNDDHQGDDHGRSGGDDHGSRGRCDR